MDWIKKNIWNLIGTALGVLGVLTGYYFYRASLQVPALSILDAGSHSLVLNYGAVSGSSIKLSRKDGSPVTQNVYVARIYVWNSGNVSLRPAAILKPLALQSADLEILDAKPAKISRADITKLATTQSSAHRVEITFDILEPGDGLALDVLYAASKPGSFKTDGAIEGVRTFSPYEIRPAGDVALRTAWELLKGGGVIAIVVGIVLAIGAGLGLVSKVVPKNRLTEWIGKYFGMVMALAFLVFILFSAAKSAKEKAIGTPDTFLPEFLRK